MDDERYQQSQRDKKAKREWEKANKIQIYEMLNTLYEKFPKAFFKEDKKIKPLKIGIREDVDEALGLANKFDPESKNQKKLVQGALKIYIKNPVYQAKLAKKLYRIDLQGKRTERVGDNDRLKNAKPPKKD